MVLPHFPNPRAEHAASIVSGDIDAVEMTSWDDLYGGINPYSLSDWYRYLNCGYLVPAVGGTDKMTAATAVGTVRTYARIDPEAGSPTRPGRRPSAAARPSSPTARCSSSRWTASPMGSRIAMSAGGGTVDVTWQVASVTVPMSRVELVVNGEIRESVAVAPEAAAGHWSVKVDKSCWLALLVRGHYADKPEIIAAHSSPVMVDVEGSPPAGRRRRRHHPRADRGRAGLPGHGRHARRGPGLQAHAPGAGIGPPHPAQPHAPGGPLPRSPDPCRVSETLREGSCSLKIDVDHVGDRPVPDLLVDAVRRGVAQVGVQRAEQPSLVQDLLRQARHHRRRIAFPPLARRRVDKAHRLAVRRGARPAGHRPGHAVDPHKEGPVLDLLLGGRHGSLIVLVAETVFVETAAPLPGQLDILHRRRPELAGRIVGRHNLT